MRYTATVNREVTTITSRRPTVQTYSDIIQPLLTQMPCC